MNTVPDRLRRTAAIAAALGVCVAVAVPSAAAAATVTSPNIVSPSRQISCYAVKYGGPAIECMAPYLPDIGDLDSFLRLRPTGRSALGQRGDFPGYTSRQVVLRYGSTWRRRGTRCTMRTTGLTCRNRSGHGFHLQRGNVRRF